MLRVLLHDSEAAKAVFEKTGLFKAPEVLEKYVIASEVTVEVLDLFLSRVFGAERASIGIGSSDLKTLWESLGCEPFRDQKSEAGEDVSVRAEAPDKAIEGLCVKVQDLERQLCAVQRQIQMQGEVSQLAVSLDDRLDKVAQECERRVCDVRSHVSAVSEDVVRLRKEVSDRASAGEVRELSEEFSRLKAGEQSLGDRISVVEKKAAKVERSMRSEIQTEIKRHHEAVKAAMDPLNGIIAQMTRDCGGNVHEKGFVEVTASSCQLGAAKNVVEIGSDSNFRTRDESSPWIRYDFKERRVAPTSYSIRKDTRGGYPRSWVLEVSNDGSDSSWQVVDRRDDNQDLNGRYVTHNFAINSPQQGSFRFVRLRQTGKNHAGNDGLRITSLEVFGTLSLE